MWNPLPHLLLASTAALGLPACQTPEQSGEPAQSEERAAVVESDAWLFGTWSGTRTSADDGDVAPLTVRIAPILGGAGVLRELEVDLGEHSYRGLSLDVFETATGQWERTYVNEPNGRFVRLSGEGRPFAGTSVWRSKPGASGKASEVRTERTEPDGWRTTVLRTKDGGATWTPVFTDEVQRAGRPHP